MSKKNTKGFRRSLSSYTPTTKIKLDSSYTTGYNLANIQPHGLDQVTLQNLATGLRDYKPPAKGIMSTGRRKNPIAYWRYGRKNTVTLSQKRLMPNAAQRAAARKFDAIEDISGITRQRPEIVMVTEFHPVFEKDRTIEENKFASQWNVRSYAKSQLTEHGRLIDARFNLDSLNVQGMRRTFRRLWKRAKRNKALMQRLKRQRRTFGNKIKRLRTTANFMIQMLRVMENTKELFDLRDLRHTAEYSQNLHSDYKEGQVIVPDDQSQYTRNELLDFTEKNLPANTSIARTMEQYGFTRTAVDSKFTSTKIWCQSVLEYRHMLEYHSAQLLDRESWANKRDQHPTALAAPTYFRLDIANRTSGLTLPTMRAIANTEPSLADINAVTNNITQAYLKMNWGIANNTTRIAAWLWLFSKEFRFSNGLAKQEVRDALKNGFRYNVSNGQNADVFESVFGLRTYAIDQVPATIGRDLFSLAYERPDTSTAVMNFESKYLEGTSGILSPGSEYYVDDVLDNFGQTVRPSKSIDTADKTNYEFDTTRLKAFVKRLDETRTAFEAVSNGMNFMAHWRGDDRKSVSSERAIAHPPTFYSWMTNKFVNMSKHELDKKYAEDNMTGVLSLAAKDVRLKSSLFMLLMLRMFREKPQTSRAPEASRGLQIGRGNFTTIRQAANVVVSKVKANVKKVRVIRTSNIKAYTSKTYTMSSAQLATMLANGSSPTWEKIEEIFRSIYNAMVDRGEVIIGDRTRYAGVLDTMMMMIAFEVLISIFEKYSKLRVNTTTRYALFPGYRTDRTSYTTSSDVIFFDSVKIDASATRREFTKVISRLFVERRRMIMGYVALYASMNTIRGNLQAFINYLESRKTKEHVQRLIGFTPGFEDPRFMRLIFNEQQMMLFASSIYDTTTMLKKFYRSPDIDADGDRDVDDAFDVLDESIVSPHVRRLFMATFGDTQFAQREGNNKQIITIGFPLGFVEAFNQSVNTDKATATSFDKKQNDIIKLNVYKVDMRHPEVIFKPQTFLFEMSRFPVRVGEAHLKVKPTATFDDVVNAIATRDLLQDPHQNGDTIYYGNTSDADIISDGHQPSSAQVKQALADETYDFLDDEEKHEILTNTALSYMLEIYIKALTNLNVGEYAFFMRPEDAVRKVNAEVVDDMVRYVLDDIIEDKSKRSPKRPTSITRPKRPRKSSHGKRNARLFTSGNWSSTKSRSGVAGTAKRDISPRTEQIIASKAGDARDLAPASINELVGKATVKDIPKLLTELRAMNAIANTYSPMSDPEAAARSYFSPRMYDRVFNIVVDPDDFEIDIDKTMATPYGKAVMEELIRDGEVEDIRLKLYRRSRYRRMINRYRRYYLARGSWKPIYRQRSRDKGEGDIIFEKYFITVETYGEDVI